jgi:outer membrane lipoprotein carrier protein
MPRLVRTLTLLAMCSSAFAAEPPASKLASAFDSHYNAVTTFKADFIETYSGAGLSRKETGTLTLKKPGKMRWDYREPRTKLFLSDGKTAYFYVPGERQARRASVKKLDDLRSPLRYLLGKAKLEKELTNLNVDVAARPSVPGNMVLVGVPRGMEERVQQVRLELTPEGRLVGIAIDELDGSRTEFVFRNVVENQPEPDSAFRFIPPSGVEVMEAQEISQ